MRLRSLIPVLAAFSLTAQHRDLGKGVNFYSKEKEAALGKQLSEEVLRQTTKLDNPEIQAYVERIGRRLAAHLPDSSWTFTFTIVTDDRGGPTREPYALPGGYIFVSSSLILGAQDEAEFAGMLAHAMIHVEARHGTREATRGQLANQASIPLIFMGVWERNDSAKILVPVGLLKFQRANELEADREAVPVLAASGYDPAALLRYITRVLPETAVPAKVFSTMPTRDERIATIKEAIQKVDEFRRIQDAVRVPAPKPIEHRPPTLLRPNER